LVLHDYGMGGLWWWIAAPSAEAIQATFKNVIVFGAAPAWWDEEVDASTPHLTLADTGNQALEMLRR
jgi:hypothetical protein